MRQWSNKALKTIVILALLYWIFKDVDFDLLAKSFKKLDPLGIALTFLMVFISDLIISWRWYYLSRFRHSFLSSLEANMLAFFLNIFAPAKLGDLSKIYYMKMKEGHDIKESSAIFVLERLFDVIVLGIILLFSTLVILPDRNNLVAVVALILLVSIFISLLIHPKWMKRALGLVPFRKVRIVLYQIFKLVNTQLTSKRAVTIFILTLFVWLGYYLNNFIFFLCATDFHLSLWQIFLASTLAFAVSAIPLTPGGIGTFQAAFILVLGWYGISKEDALAASLVLQILYILPATLFSLYLFLTKDFLNGKWYVSAK